MLGDGSQSGVERLGDSDKDTTWWDRKSDAADYIWAGPRNKRKHLRGGKEERQGTSGPAGCRGDAHVEIIWGGSELDWASSPEHLIYSTRKDLIIF